LPRAQIERLRGKAVTRARKPTRPPAARQAET
jgi:hypothetical protein